MGFESGFEPVGRGLFSNARIDPQAIRINGFTADYFRPASLQPRNAEPVAITRARKFIQEHQTDDLSLAEVARAVNTSTIYFCKLFKKVTGLNFTEYLSQLRIEKAKNLLLNPNLRVSEIAYETGFQSLTHFNRVFRRIAGQSPTNYRKRLVKV